MINLTHLNGEAVVVNAELIVLVAFWGVVGVAASRGDPGCFRRWVGAVRAHCRPQQHRLSTI